MHYKCCTKKVSRVRRDRNFSSLVVWYFMELKEDQGLRKHSRLMLNIYKKYAWLPQQNMLLDLAGHELVLQHNDSHKTQLFARGDDHRTGPLDLSMGFGFSKSKHLCIWSTYARSNLLRELYIGYN